MTLLRFSDARYFQIIFQCIFLFYGLYIFQWNTDNWLFFAYFLSSMFVQALMEGMLAWRKGKLSIGYWWQSYRTGLPSVIVSSLGLSLFLRTDEPYVAILAAFVAIASKYIVRIRNKHIFNPSALGIVVAVWMTKEAWVNPGQWGSGMIQLFGGLILGLIVVTKVQKLDISLSFLLTFIGLLFIRQVLYLGWPVDFFIQSVSTGTVLVFSFFMISDPKTAPDHPTARIIWGMLVAVLAFYLVSFRFVNGAPVLALILIQPVVPVLDILFKARPFSWGSTKLETPASVIPVTLLKS